MQLILFVSVVTSDMNLIVIYCPICLRIPGSLITASLYSSSDNSLCSITVCFVLLFFCFFGVFLFVFWFCFVCSFFVCLFVFCCAKFYFSLQR